MTPSRPVLVVADSSVLAQWILPDEETCPGAERLMTDVGSRHVTLLEPPLLAHELANTLSVAVKRRRMPDDDALLAWQAFSDLGMLFESPGGHGPLVLKLSTLPGVTAYDASYVVLAEDHQCAFYTADKRLAAALRGHSDHVRMITEYI